MMVADILTENEAEVLITQLAKGQGIFTEDDAGIVLTWARQTRIRHELLELILRQEIEVSLKDGEVTFQFAQHVIEELEGERR